MGDRGNIVVKQENGQELWMYSHWNGRELPILLRDALKKGRDRWDDEPYLGRIIFQAMLLGDDGTTGFGLTTYPTDNEYPVLVVDAAQKTVAVGRFKEMGHLSAPCPFSTFAALTDEQAMAFRENGGLSAVDGPSP